MYIYNIWKYNTMFSIRNIFSMPFHVFMMKRYFVNIFIIIFLFLLLNNLLWRQLLPHPFLLVFDLAYFFDIYVAFMVIYHVYIYDGDDDYVWKKK